MSADSESSGQSAPPGKVRTQKYVRRAGYVVCMVGGFAIFVMMMVGVVNGIRQESAWDPYTGQPVESQQCLEDARQLLMDAGAKTELDPPWVGRYRKWVSRCKDHHDDLYEILSDTHSDLQQLDSDES